MMMDQYIQVSLILMKIKEMEEEFYYGKINQNIKENGKKINPMEKGNIFIQMVIIIQENGKMEK